MVNGFTHFLQERLIHFKKMVPLSFTFFIYLFGWGLVTPIFNIRINDVTGSLFLSGIVFSIFSFVKIFLDPSIGLFFNGHYYLTLLYFFFTLLLTLLLN